MTNFYRYWLLLVAFISLGALPSQAQYTWSNATNFAPYTQNFNTLAGTVTFANNSTLTGVYAQAEFPGNPNPFIAQFNPTAIQANDGSNTAAQYYHFGTSGNTDRAFGGIASTDYSNGTGHVGIRLKNSSTTTIRTLDIVYAMEHWYNSGRVDGARVDVSYQKSAVGGTITTLFNTSGTWISIPDLGVNAPSTATVIASRDGNSSANRRVRQATLSSIDLAPNQEIMIRWSYVLNNTTNGNGLSIDDVTIAAFSNIFYSKTDGDLDKTSTWSSSADGKDALPTGFSFSLPNAVYYVQGNTSGSNSASLSRINGTNNASTTSAWTVDGANSRIVVGVPGATVATRLYLHDNDNINGRIDVENNATLAIQQPNYTFSLGQLDNASTVEYTNPANMNIQVAAYGNLQLSGAGTRNLLGSTLVNGNLIFNPTAALTMVLGESNLTIQRGGQIQGASNAAFVVTNGKGQLRQSVTNNGMDVPFPVGSSATSYTPAFLQQPSSTTARNEDVFSVRVADGMYARYDATESGTGTAVTNQNVKKTWFVSEEVMGNSNITMGLQWNNADEVTGFTRNSAYVSHYLATRSSAYFDKPSELGGIAAGTVANSYRVNRNSITSFSPFSVSSRPDMPLPVELSAFSARRLGTAVVCRWTTASEKNSAKFIIERSADGRDFQAIGTVAAAGTSTAMHTYSFTDQQPLAGVAYYRLRQVDEDATESFSPVVTVAGCAQCLADNVLITPNPSSGLFELYTNLESIIVSGTVRNAIGKTIVTLDQQVPVGPQRLLLDLTQQPAGVYLMQLQTSSGSFVRKIVKQ
ncbi:T9SS type A sorting domain-containing protein [Hymenobacter crusticola]|uniref:Secretion system C-terminal sorting domain-containing protein n=1 Tax=Hymenobacter crusticola TaxID=1770526 RepID=A0A243WJ66_9BACT|nr:T9SS type A sorting domain-containing protein [Hymenobacter crusticola]OUJ75953.1 hypothetical protein BXP70_01315 [Hymenobacter crusticola]